jgi:predicted PurR-regulated permease PerM
MAKFTDQAERINSETGSTPLPRDNLERRVFRATVIFLATCVAAYLIYVLIDVLLLLFACSLVALVFLTMTNAIRRRTGVPFAVALGASVLTLLGVLVGAFAFFGTTMQSEFTTLAQQLPAAWADVQLRLQASPLGTRILEQAQGLAPSGQAVVNAATTALATLGGALSGLALVLVGGLYLAAQPNLYQGGLLRLVPNRSRTSIAETLDAVTVSLRNWLKGQALGMLFVGVATGVGLWLVGVPAAFAIGLVAGLAEFVPYLGIIVAVLPALILGFGQGTDVGIWTVVVLIAVQQVQGNLVMPLLQNKMVDLPPAITIFGIIAAGILFGVAGVLLATPLTIVVLVLVRRLYLGEDKQEVLHSSGDPEPRPGPPTPPGD